MDYSNDFSLFPKYVHISQTVDIVSDDEEGHPGASCPEVLVISDSEEGDDCVLIVPQDAGPVTISDDDSSNDVPVVVAPQISVDYESESEEDSNAPFIQRAYASREKNTTGHWLPCRVLEANPSPTKNSFIYNVCFHREPGKPHRTVQGTEVAEYAQPEDTPRLGVRVLALSQYDTQKRFRPGVIVEAQSEYNEFRFLVFFEDGNVQYTYTEDIRCMFCSSRDVWDDVRPEFSQFIKRYLQQSATLRPVINVQVGDTLVTQCPSGDWCDSRVIDHDCSILLMQFEDKHTEWLHNSSQRFEFVRNHKMLTEDRRSNSCPAVGSNEVDTKPPVTGGIRTKARKIPFRRPSACQVSRASNTIGSDVEYLVECCQPDSLVKFNLYALPGSFVELQAEHSCDESCQRFELKVPMLHREAMLMQPLLCGYTRHVYATTKYTSHVTYRTPCGRRLNTIRETFAFLKATNSSFSPDHFSFDERVCPVLKYEFNSNHIKISDITNGLEQLAIPCANSIDDTLPKPFKYSTQRVPTDTVPLILDENLLSCCDCDDNCSDVEKCACRKLSEASWKYLESSDYMGKRLSSVMNTGIYECNSRCKCNDTCLNRVVQNPMNKLLYVYNTPKSGWGVRCREDIQEGTFICIYTGEILDEDSANRRGIANDVFFADLDFLEVASKIKEGYEETVRTDSDDEMSPPPPPRRRSADSEQIVKRRMRLRSDTIHMSNPPKPIAKKKTPKKKDVTMKSICCLNGDGLYVVDGMHTSNVGRYFNHSCNPNMITQNVFVDTHDLRFPWVAFFASQFIPAGSELTWHYNYNVGSVEGKELLCHCGSKHCQKRLL